MHTIELAAAVTDEARARRSTISRPQYMYCNLTTRLCNKYAPGALASQITAVKILDTSYANPKLRMTRISRKASNRFSLFYHDLPVIDDLRGSAYGYIQTQR